MLESVCRKLELKLRPGYLAPNCETIDCDLSRGSILSVDFDVNDFEFNRL